MRIGLLGFGTVGQGVYELVQARRDMEVAKVLCRRHRAIPGTETVCSFDEILNDPTIDTVVEAIGGLHPAWDYVKAAIQAGKNVVTSNKALVAGFYDELIPLTEKMGVRFRCTAAVGGGIGWLSELERVRRVEEINQVSGIMNGTCNYILDSMTSRGLPYAEALRSAQSLGYAEADPTTDVDGIDTWHKLIVSANIAFGVSLDISAIPYAGIRFIRKEDIDAFRDRDLVCKLMATGRNLGDSFGAYVQPMLIPRAEPEYYVPVNFNLITLVGSVSGRQSLYGQGAGRYPTAYNVVQDCADFLQGNGFYGSCGKKGKVVNNDKMRYYVRGDAEELPEDWKTERWGNAIITIPVAVRDMHNWLKEHPGTFIASLPN